MLDGGVVSVRVAQADVALLEEVAGRHKYARRGAVAREALRRGLAMMRAEIAGTRGGR